MKKERCKICRKPLTNGYCPVCGWQERYSYATTEKSTEIALDKRKTSKIAWGIVCVVLISLPLLMNTPPAELFIDSVRQGQVMTAIPTSVYKNTSRELSGEGSAIQSTLEAGNYIVGIDIPEGTYHVSVVSQTSNIAIKDEMNQIDFFSYLRMESDMEPCNLQDVRLYQGAILHIEMGKLLFASSNAQVDAMQALPQNETLEPCNVADGAVAGVDFPTGTYDILVSGKGYGLVEVSFPENNRNALGFSDTMGNNEGDLMRFNNVEFPKGTLLEISNVEISLVPSTRNSLMR